MQAIDDLFVWVPNALGLLLGLAQVGLCLVFPGAPKGALKKVRSSQSSSEEDGLI